jgi:hypothetical protein
MTFRRWRKYEDGLGVIELARDRLHLLIGQPARIRHHRQRVPSVQMIGKNVGGVKGVGHASKNVRRAGPNGYQWRERLDHERPDSPLFREDRRSVALNKHS